ncbi:MAG TPA: RNA 2',3'-cyclic phosphodiesterase [Candidatus Nanoarchaeia archaeon]|nr:RNA 2',3'-cyclic phosphodiesterase [Candidatus Nanoarchaeia archaeon]
MRLFIAVEIPEEHKGYLRELQKKIKCDEAMMTFVRDFHLTLKFLGEVDEKKIDEIKGLIDCADFKRFEAFVDDKIGFFPSEKNPRVIWLNIEPEEKFAELKEIIDNKLEKLFVKDKNFKAHITLARIKFVKEKELFQKKIDEIKKNMLEKKHFAVDSFKLKRSVISRKGPEYEDVFVKKL